MSRFFSRGRFAFRAGRPVFHGLALSGLLVVAAFLTSTANADEVLYAGDYNGNQVARFNGVTGAPLAGNPFITPGGESIAGYGAFILAEGASTDTVRQYNLSDGSFTGNSIKLAAFGLGIAVALDGNSVYITESGHIVQYSLQSGTFGAILASASTPDSWGVSINPNTGKVIVNNGWSGGGSGIQEFNANLTGGTTLVAAGDHGLSAGAGIVFNKSGTDFYAVNGGNAQPSPSNTFVNEYTAAGTFVTKIALGSVGGSFGNAFGAAINDAGNIFVSSQGYNAVAEIDVGKSNATSLFLNGAGTTDSIKTIFFSGQTVNPVPEPASIVLILSAIPVGMAVVWVRRRRQTVA